MSSSHSSRRRAPPWCARTASRFHVTLREFSPSTLLASLLTRFWTEEASVGRTHVFLVCVARSRVGYFFSVLSSCFLAASAFRAFGAALHECACVFLFPPWLCCGRNSTTEAPGYSQPLVPVLTARPRVLPFSTVASTTSVVLGAQLLWNSSYQRLDAQLRWVEIICTVSAVYALTEAPETLDAAPCEFPAARLCFIEHDAVPNRRY